MQKKHNHNNHNFTTTHKFTNLGFNTAIPLYITNEGFEWKSNKNDCVVINTHPLHGSIAPSYNVLSTYILFFASIVL